MSTQPPGPGQGFPYAPTQPYEPPPGGPGGYAPGPPPGWEGGRQDRGAEMAQRAEQFARRHIRTPETKEFFKTSEFFVWGLTALSILLAAAISDTLDSTHAWLAVCALSISYILSRGISKAGTRRGERDALETGAGMDQDRGAPFARAPY